jgi:hypothetical protein
MAFGIEKSFDFPFIELWYKLKCLWSKDGFIEWLESVTPRVTQRGCNPSDVQENPHSMYASIILPMIYFNNIFSSHVVYVVLQSW